MAYRRLKLFMKKLKQIIYGYNDLRIGIHLSKSYERHPLQLLYEELESMIQTLFVEKENGLHKPAQLQVILNLKRRFKDVVEEVHDMLDLFVSNNNLSSKNQKYYMVDFPQELVDDVMRSIKSIKEDYFSILHKMELESSPEADSPKTQTAASAVTSYSRDSQDVLVGLDRDVDLIREKLCQNTKKLEIVSIVGMGGSGKTTLATKVFNDGFVCYNFKIRGWITVSQTFEKKDLLYQILDSAKVEIDPNKRHNYSHLHEMLHKHILEKRQRYLFVIDDIWNTEAWDVLKVLFPNSNKGSRLLLARRHKNVALHAEPHGYIHQLRCLTDEESWELMHKKVFHGHNFPDWVTGPGMQIARNCCGLPLAVVVIAGLLAKEPVTEHMGKSFSECQFGGFPEDYKFQVTWLIWLWIAEGFIQESENQSLEETAKDYVMELVDRYLVVVQDRKVGGAIKTITVHDVLRELSSEIATKERFNIKVLGWENCIIAPYKTSRLLIRSSKLPRPFSEYLSVWTFFKHYMYSYDSYIVLKCSRSWRLLTVLDLKQYHPLPKEISLLVNLRYLVIRNEDRDFQSTICAHRCLQTLIIEGISNDPLMLPKTISNLVNLRHLQCRRAIIFPQLQIPFMKLQTIFNVDMGHESTIWGNYFPCVKKLSCIIHGDRKYDFKTLTFLEILKISCAKSKRIPRFKKKNMIRLPASLKMLTVKECHFPWSSMSNIQSLPNIEVLKLLTHAFVGPRWDAGEEPFQQLKYLKLSCLDIQQWEASSINFPCLKLVFDDCYSLEGIPLVTTLLSSPLTKYKKSIMLLETMT